jgi:leader peptidase (prepilin peptidase)/N-methyltransferase
VPEGESIVRPRSRCPKCGHQLPWYENIPVVSWLWLRGKCSGCKAPISPRYVLVELLTGTLFVTATTRFPFDWALVSALVFITLLVPLVFIDAEHWILPFELTLPGIAAGLLLAIPQGQAVFVTALIGAVAGFLAFRVMEFLGWYATGREALGAGDKYLLAMVGAQLGWRPLLGVILFSSLQGAVYGLVRMKLTGRAGPTVGGGPPDASSEQAEAPDAQPPAEAESDDANWREPFTPAFLAPGLPLWRRLVLVPYTLFLQDIPDSPPVDEETGEEPEWKPGASNMPFGPWIGLAAVEVLFLGPWLVETLNRTPFRLTAEILLGR